MANSQQPILEVRDLTTRFYTDDGVVNAVNGVSYALYEKETIGIVGESGSGKSAHALSIMGLIRPPNGRVVAGQVRYRDTDLLRLSQAQLRRIRGAEIAMIFQDPMTSLNPVFTVGDQIEESLRHHLNLSKSAAAERAAELLTLVGIGKARELLDVYPHQLSGGMRQRVMISIALAADPQILIADEPTTALDVTIQAQIIELVNQLRERLNMALIWISHDLGVIASIADRVLVMYAGEIVEEAPVRELYQNPRHPYTLGLLQSIPRVDQERGGQPIPIPGNPPDLSSPAQGCPFAERCPYQLERCLTEPPPFEPVGDKHRAACWVDIRTAERREVAT